MWRHRKAFLQIHIEESFRDTLRFLQIKDHDLQQMVIYKLIKLTFLLVQIPKQIIHDLYLDDLIAGGDNIFNVKILEEATIQEVFKKRINK